jgi:hypothetical protein
MIEDELRRREIMRRVRDDERQLMDRGVDSQEIRRRNPGFIMSDNKKKEQEE